MKIEFLERTGKQPVELESLAGANLSGVDLCEADLSGADLRGANLSWADLREADLSGANLRGANLRGADLCAANLYGANLYGANLSGASLRGADLCEADLCEADLSGADLSGADLSRAHLGDQWLIQGATRSDGYQFLLQQLTSENEPYVKAGCRYFTLPQAREHWSKTRGSTPLGNETFAILDCLETLAKIRGYIK